MTIKIGNPSKKNSELISIIKKAKIDTYYIKNKKDFREEILNSLRFDDVVLDIGKSMRDKHIKIPSKKKITLDVNQYSDYPDILFDLCDELNDKLIDQYDKIICLSILEHVYDPFKAVNNLHSMLKNNGVLYGYVPYLYHYHAPSNLKFQDYFRFSKDALIYLFKEFSDLKLFPIRGRISTPLNILFAGRWKKYMEKFPINMFLDKFVTDEINEKQCSGFNFIAKK